jgi:hypothetical protein
MIATPFGLSTLHSGTALVTPSVVAVQPLVRDTPGDWTSLTFNFSAPTGNMIVVFCTRSNDADPSGILSVSWAGAALNESADVEVDEQFAAIGWAGWIRGGASGAQDLIVTATSSDFRDLVGYAIMLDRLAATPLGDVDALSVRITQSAIVVPNQPTVQASRIISFAGCVNENLFPFSLSSGWDVLGPQAGGHRTGNNTTGDVAGICGTRLAAPSLAATDMTASTAAAGAPTAADWTRISLEVLPA